MFQDTSYTSPEWLLAIYIPPISIARLPFLHGLSCISGFDNFFSMALLTDGKQDYFVALICLSRLLVGQKGCMRFFLNIFWKKSIRPFWPRASLSTFCRFSCAFKVIQTYLLKSVSCNSALLSKPLRWLPSIYLWMRVIICNSAGLWIALPLSSFFQLAFLGAGRKSAGLLQALFWFHVPGWACG